MSSDLQSDSFMSSENHFPIQARPFGQELCLMNGTPLRCGGDSAFKSPSLNRKAGAFNPNQHNNTSSEKQFPK